jgi:hypothetical protein
MPRRSYSRRQALRRGGGAILAVAGLSGCTELGVGGTGSTEVPYYATWAPTPDRVLGNSENRGGARGLSPIAVTRFGELAAYLRQRDESFDRTSLYQDGKAHPVLDIEPDAAGTEIRAGRDGISVLESELPEEDVVEAFRTPGPRGPIDEPFEEVGEYEGYRLLTADDDWVVGVDGGLVVEAFSASGAGDAFVGKRDVVEAVIDARDGRGRYIDADPTLEELVTRLGAGLFVRIDPPIQGSASSPGTDGDPIASGVAFTGAEAGNAKRVLAFGSEAASEGFLDDPDQEGSDGWSDVSMSRDGRYVSISGTHHPVPAA